MDVTASRLSCAVTMRSHARSFYFATRMLPRLKREAIEALFGFFHCVESAAGDDEGTSSANVRRTQLAHFRRDVAGLQIAGYRSCQSWFAALSAAFDDFALDPQPLLDFVDGHDRALDGPDIGSLRELERHARAVAGTAARSIACVLGVRDEDSLRRAEQLGIAMQLTNVLRDVPRDRAGGRNYLPMAQFPGAPIATVMRVVAMGARQRFADARALARRLPDDGSRVAALTASATYESLLRGLERDGFGVDAEVLRA